MSDGEPTIVISGEEAGYPWQVKALLRLEVSVHVVRVARDVPLPSGKGIKIKH